MTSPAMVARVAATQRIVDEWRYRPFAWGVADCGRLAAAMLTALGHSPRLARFGYYRSAAGAARSLRRRGFSDVGGVLDDLGLTRIPQASALPGDLVGFRQVELGQDLAVSVAVGNGRVLGFMDNGDGAVLCHVFPPRMDAAAADYLAWRADPL